MFRHVLVQVYTGRKGDRIFKTMAEELRHFLPNARIFRWTEREEEGNGDDASRKTVLSFTVFENTSVDELTRQLAQLNQDLQESEQRYKSLFEHNPNMIYSMDARGIILSANPAMTKETGYLPEEICGTPALDYVAEDDSKEILEYFQKTLEGEPQHFSMKIKRKGGGAQLFQVTNIPIVVNESIVGVYGVAQNITKQKLNQEKITRLAYHDVLTSLPNRLLFQQTLESALKRAKRRGQKMAVMFIDLDRFKMINDSVGHYHGDQILKQAALRLENVMEKNHVLSRFSGDEFMLLIPKTDGTEAVRETARSLADAFHTPIIYDGRQFFLSISIGVSIYPDDAASDEELMKNADTALNLAKQHGTGNIQFYKQEMKHDFADRLEMENDLRRALDNEEFTLFYQPQMDVYNGKVSGGEALIRWRHPKLGLISPGTFIPVAEETGLIEEIGRWVLKTACRQAKEWQEGGFPDFSVSVNVSARQFQRSGFLNDVRSALRESGLNPEYLHLELTESITLHDMRHSMQHLKALKKLGVKVSIDDFGTGYSSFSYLKDFSIDILKIDRSFIRNLRDGSHDGAIIKAILTMCDGLSVTAVAEGVENEEQLNLLKTFGCNYVQGFFYSRPLPVEQFEHFIREANAQVH